MIEVNEEATFSATGLMNKTQMLSNPVKQLLRRDLRFFNF